LVIPDSRLILPPVITWRFFNTQVSSKVENAFQALALDEPRGSFRPAIWERPPQKKGFQTAPVTNLKQVWFPGTHSNIGGGWYDQQVADITLAWMCDQLSTSAGVEFDSTRLVATFTKTLRYMAAHPFPYVPKTLFHDAPGDIPWANIALFDTSSDSHGSHERDKEDCTGKDTHPSGPPQELWTTARSWALGQLRAPTSLLQKALGSTVRRPGLAMRTDPETNEETDEPLIDTGESVHSSVRVRLACQGLGLDDRKTWECGPLTKDEHGNKLWKLERCDAKQVEDLDDRVEILNVANNPDNTGEELYTTRAEDDAWKWTYQQPVRMSKEGDEQVPLSVVLPEEPLTGVWERLLLAMYVGTTDVWRYAQDNAVGVAE
jgi:hypothetical protein